MSTTIHVPLGDRTYPIHIGNGLLSRFDELLKPVVRGRKALIVTDSTVGPLYANACQDAIARLGLDVAVATVPAGEASKNSTELAGLWEKAVVAGLDRKSCIVALGGGVVGDLAGFAAASYLRGVQLIQIPTTLLAMVDSAVGGKTGINLPQGKNLVGAFHQPSLVACDIGSLTSLPRRELVAGMAEVVKYGVIRDAELFAYIEAHAERVLAGDPQVLAKLVARSCEIKAEVVGKDEREDGLRAILNFGHTMGHALEAVAGYGHFLHGEAIAVGMVYAARVSEALLHFPAAETQRLISLLKKLGLPVAAPEFAFEPLRRAMGVDKKTSLGKLKFVLARRLGEVEFGCEVTDDLLARTWAGN